MIQHEYLLRFQNMSQAEASLSAEELRNFLLDASPDISVQRKREDTQTQDFGTTLVLLLGTPTVVAATTAIGNWLSMRNKASLSIETHDKKVHITNITNKDAAQLAQILLAHQQEETK